ncbi:MAG: 50S ribosomal protein L29 [Bdellovibrionota bacterium]|nr:50S ribosomal protein L29 [Pseudomonadota bacterium]MDY6089749.1 50S ribosomal protein L29 [Bdellovibrionota bacterium]
MKNKEYLKELEGLDVSALNQKERELREEIMKYRFRIATGQLDKSNLVSLAKKNLARVKTVLNSKK